VIAIKNLSIQLGKFFLNDIHLAIPDKEYFVILGPTGAGKTILLECIAGILPVKNGEIWFDSNNVTWIPPEQRHIGYVPQDFVLFPFLSVKENVVFGVKKSRKNTIEFQNYLQKLINLTGISHILDRDTRSLSGGEKQRVAIARALAPDTHILLLDEPLSSVDVQTAKHLRMELRRIHNELGVTTIHITHNHLEAEELADRIAIVVNGKIEQVDEPQNIFFSPRNVIVSDFIGSLNILNCDSSRQLVPGLVEVNCDGLGILVPHVGGTINKIAISPRDTYLSETQPPGPEVNRYKGRIQLIENHGSLVIVGVNVGNHLIYSELPIDLFEEMNLNIGLDVYLILKLRRLRVLSISK
jgi:ABC-type sugar transport system ATPase subunit